MTKINKLSSMTAFFPSYNEEKNVQNTVEKALEVFSRFTDDLEVIVVNDGSRDRTAEIADKLAATYPNVRVVHHEKNKGYGGAVRSGIRAATKDWIFFSDGDLQFDFNELEKFLEYTEEYRAIIGYRIKRAEGFKRARNALMFRTFVDFLFQLGVRDIDCAFKLFRREDVQELDLISDGAVISTELLFRLKRRGLKLKEVPVNHYLRVHGTQTGAHPKVILKAGVESLKLFCKVRLKRSA